MQHKTLTIINKLGLHARASMKLVNLAGRFGSEIVIKYQDREVNAKSIMGIMVLAVTQGNDIEVTVTGDDEERAMKAIEELLADRFGEEE